MGVANAPHIPSQFNEYNAVIYEYNFTNEIFFVNTFSQSPMLFS